MGHPEKVEDQAPSDAVAALDRPVVPEWLQEYEEELDALTGGKGPEFEPEHLDQRESVLDHWLERLAKVRERMAHNSEVARRRIEIIQRWEEDERATLERQEEWIHGRIRALVPATDSAGFQKVFGGKAKSRKLPHGTVGFRASRDTVEFDEPDQVVAFCKEKGLEYKVAESPLKKPVVEYITKTGDVEVPGARFVPGEDTFFCKPADPQG